MPFVSYIHKSAQQHTLKEIALLFFKRENV